MKPSTALCLAALRASHGAWISGNELAHASGWRFSARVYELRAEGYVIERRSSRNGWAVDEYRLVESEQLRLGVA